MENKFRKVHAPKDLIISGVILFAGIGLFFVNKGLGVCVFLCGLLSLLLYKSGYKKEGDNIVLKKKELDISSVCRQSVMDFLEGKNVNPDIHRGSEGGTILLELWYNLNQHVAYAQLSDYKELSFQKATDVVEIPVDSVPQLLAK